MKDDGAMWVFLEKSEVTFDRETVGIVVAAFEDAWQRLVASGASVPHEKADQTRERLAKYIIETAKAGERDQRQLRDAALLHFSQANLKRSSSSGRGSQLSS